MRPEWKGTRLEPEATASDALVQITKGAFVYERQVEHVAIREAADRSERRTDWFGFRRDTVEDCGNVLGLLVC